MLPWSIKPRAGKSGPAWPRWLNVFTIFVTLLTAAPGISAQEPERTDTAWLDKVIESVQESYRALYKLSPLPGLKEAELWDPRAIPPEISFLAGDSETYTARTLYLQALNNNRELAQLRITGNIAKIQGSKAKASRFPKIDFEAGMAYLTNPMEKISLTMGQLGSYTLPGGETVLIPPQDVLIYKGMENTYYQFKVTALQPLFTWGKIPLAIELSGLSLQANQINQEKKKREILTEISILVYSLGVMNKIEETLYLQEEVGQRLVQISTENFEGGFILYADLLEAKIQSKQIDIAMAQLTEQRSRLIQRLKRLGGFTSLSYTQIELPNHLLSPEDLPIPILAPVLKGALENNPDLELLRLLRQVEEKKIRLAEAGGYLKPDIALQLELSYGGPRFPLIEKDWFGQGSHNITSTLGFKTTLFDGGVKAADILEEAQNLENALLQAEEGFLAIEQYISQTILSLDLIKKSMEYQKLKIENSQAQVDLRKTQFEAGTGMEVQYLTAQISLYADIAEYYKMSLDYYSNYAALANAAGFQDPIIKEGDL